ncbi:MAG: hypothetical protein IKI95_01545 [Clostridia bacterium]|nr:hypothetical protein [Clostridia bacterium]
MIKTIFGEIDETSLLLYNEDLKNRTFALLYLYEQQPFETYQKRLNDLICGAVSFQKIKLQKHPDFCKYIEKLVAILEPQPLQLENEHDFIRRHILDAVNILGRMIQDFRKAVEDGKQ